MVPQYRQRSYYLSSPFGGLWSEKSGQNNDEPHGYERDSRVAVIMNR